MSIDAYGSLEGFAFVKNEEGTKEAMSEMYFRRLNKSIGKRVACWFVSENKRKLIFGTLEKTTDYQSVVIDGKELAFIGENEAIMSITSDETLYSNDNINEGYSVQDMLRQRREMFGSAFVDKETTNLILKLKNR